MRLRVLVLAVLVLASAAAAGCGGDGAGGEAPATTAEPAASGAALVWAVGDLDAREPRAADVVRQIARTDPDRVLYLGDVYERGTAREFEENFDAVYHPLAERTLPTPGNHEWELRREGYFPYWEAVHGEPQPEWYRERIGGWEIVSLNSETDFGPGSPQHEWLSDLLEDAEGDCRIVFWHAPRYSAGVEHGDQPRVDPLWDLVRGHARIVLAGHDHNLQRLRPIEGTVQFVSGAGGRRLYESDEEDPRVAFDEDDEYGALRLDLRPGVARHRFVSADGAVLDDGRITCKKT